MLQGTSSTVTSPDMTIYRYCANSASNLANSKRTVALGELIKCVYRSFLEEPRVPGNHTDFLNVS